MEIIIDKQLRELRKKRSRKQEDLAQFLNISPQAVSKWERGERFPDITFLPAIAMFYDVTVDELLGVGEIRKKQKLEKYAIHSKKLWNQGNITELVALWRKAAQEFPNEAQCKHELMFALSGLDGSTGSDHKDEIISLGEYILRESTVQSWREGAVQVLCMVYRDVGNMEKAKEYAKMGGDSFATSDLLLGRILDGEEGKKKGLENLMVSLDATYCILHDLDRIAKCDGNLDSQIMLEEFYLRLLDLYFDDGNFGVHYAEAQEKHYALARLYAQKNDEKMVCGHLTAAAECALKFDALPEKVVYTSTLMKDHVYERINASKTYQESQTEYFLQLLQERNSPISVYCTRDWYAAIVDKMTL